MFDKIFSLVYEKFFGREPGEVAKNFMRNISFVAVGIFLSKLFIMVFQLSMGRILGAAEYGKFTVIITISEFMYIPMTISFIAMVKYLSEKKERKDKIISTSFVITLLLIIIFIGVYYLLRNQLALFLNVHISYILWAMVITISLVIWALITRIAQALELMKSFSVIHIVRGFFLLVVSLGLVIYLGNDVRYPILGYIVGFLVSSLVLLPVLLRIKFRYDSVWAGRLFKYGLVLFIGVAAAAIVKNIDKLFINSLLGLKAVGIYQAYITASFGISIMFVAIFFTVFFPESSKRDKRLVWDRIKVVLKHSYLIFICIFVGSIPLIYLYGEEYGFNFGYILLFSIGASMAFLHSMLSGYSASFGIKGAMNSTIAILLAAGFNVVLNLSLIPIFGIYGAISATIFSYMISVFYLGIISRRALLKGYAYS